MTGPLPNDLRVFDGPWTEAPAGAVLAITDRYDEFILALRIRAEAAGLAYLDLDHIAGFSSGVTSRIFGPAQSLGLGPLSMGRLLKALKLKVALVAEKMPVPPRLKDCRQDRHPLVSPHLPPRDDGPHQPAPSP
jgi:hypothetical protein